MNYLQQKNNMRLDIDKFSRYSYHFGGFMLSNGGEKILASIRTITPHIQKIYSQMIDEILIENEIPLQLVDANLDPSEVKTLQDFVDIERQADFLFAESMNVDHLLENYKRTCVS
jgi:CRISPR/Cas system-associated endonuclease/helicase Cas3